MRRWFASGLVLILTACGSKAAPVQGNIPPYTVCTAGTGACDADSGSVDSGGDAYPTNVADAAPGVVSCEGALSLDDLCCSNKYVLGTACPRDYGSLVALCGDANLHLFLEPTACGGFVFITLGETDTAYVIAFDATTGALRAVLYGLETYECSGAADPSVVIPGECLAQVGLKVCNSSANDGGTFASFCATRPEGDPACPTSFNAQCDYPTSCIGGHCVYGVDAGPDGN